MQLESKQITASRLKTLEASHLPSTLTRARRILLDTIMCQTGINLSQESIQFFRTFDTWTKHEGIRSATLRLKNVFLVVRCHAFNQPNPNIPFLRTTDGFPSAFLYLRKFCKTPQGQQAVLSLLGWYRGVKAPGMPDFSSITREGIKTPLDVINRIVHEIKPNERFNLSTLSPPKLELRAKQGPNGKATLTCLADLKALPDTLVDSIVEISELLQADDFIDSLYELRDLAQETLSNYTKPLFHSKLAIQRELGGKDRVFAIVDYWTQACLKPLHIKLNEILRTISQDCTFDQGKGSSLIKAWTETSNEIYSFDLKSATDRFPRELQSKVLEHLTNDSGFALNWNNLISNRDFTYKGKTYRWATGQPLGAYSSWPIFAFSHHLVVRAAARLSKSEPSYFLLGDDIVLKGRALAETYQSLMKAMGVDISSEKSLIGCQAEFAKRLFSQGHEVSPVPVRMLAAASRDPFLIGEVCETLLSRSSNKTAMGNLRGSALRAFAGSHRHQFEEILAVGSKYWTPTCMLMQVGTRIGPEGKTPILHRITSPWPRCRNENYNSVYCSVKYKYLLSHYQKSAKLTEKFSNQIRQLELLGTPQKGDIRHPIWKAVDRQKEFFKSAHRAIGKHWTSLTKSKALMPELLPHVESFDLDSLTKSYQARTKHSATIIVLTYRALLKAKQVFGEDLELQVIPPGRLIKAIEGVTESSKAEPNTS